MPIECNEQKVIIPIEYTDEANPSVFYYIRYHFTDDFGPTLSFSTDGESFDGYPAQACLEAVLHLIHRGVLKAPKGTSQTVQNNLRKVTSRANPVETTLPLPNITGEGNSDPDSSNGTIPLPEIDSADESNFEPLTVDGDMVQTFSPTSVGAKPLQDAPAVPDQIEEAIANIDEGVVEENSATESPAIQKEDKKKMLEERIKATEKADRGLKKAAFRTKHGLQQE